MKNAVTQYGMRSLVVAALLAPLAGCGKSEQATGPSANETAPVASTAVAESAGASAQLGTKLNGYVECYNRVDGGVQRAAQRYASWLTDVEQGPTGKETRVYALGEVPTTWVDTCSQEIEQALAAKPALAELDAAGKQYLEQLKALAPKVNQAHAYYDQEDYKDDAFAKGQQLHAPLMAAFQSFSQASDVFSQALDKENDALLRTHLAQIEKEQGRNTAYYSIALLDNAKGLAVALQSDAPDNDKLAAGIAAYSQMIDDAAKDTAQEQNKPITWSIFENSATEFLKAAKERQRRLRDKTPYSAGEQSLLAAGPNSEWMVEGTPGKVMKAYNDLVDASNRL